MRLKSIDNSRFCKYNNRINARNRGDTINISMLRKHIKANNLTIAQVADKMEINQSTFYRKLRSNGETFSIAETKSLAKILNLTASDCKDIFFSE